MYSDDFIEPILEENPRRFVLFPIKYFAIWKAYKKAMTIFWIADTIKTAEDEDDWTETLSNAEKEITTFALNFFVETRKLHQNLLNVVSGEVTIPEARCFFGFQNMMENVHAEAMSKFASVFAIDEAEWEQTLHLISVSKTLLKKAEWSEKWTDDVDSPFPDLLIALAAIKGLFSSSVSCILSWLGERGILPGLAHTHTLIALDDESYLDFSCLLFHHLVRRPTEVHVVDIILEAVELEKAFATELFSLCGVEITSESMHEYIEYLADMILCSMGYKRHFNTPNPLPFMHHLSGEVKATFFLSQIAMGSYPNAVKSMRDAEIKTQIVDLFNEELR